MKHYTMLFLVIFLSATLGACAGSKYKKVEQSAKEPVNCATAEADLRTLKSEKVHTAERIAAGVQSIVPISLVVGLVTKTEESNWHVTTGEYNDMLDKKIAQIKQECGLD